MKFRSLVLATAFVLAGGAGAQTLNVITAGDQNMVDYVNNYLAPKFEAMNPGVKVRAVGTGPGDSGSQKIYEKLSAQQKAESVDWDVDVAVVHQRGAADDGRRKAADAVSKRGRRRASSSRAIPQRTRSGRTSTATCCRCSTARSRLRTTPSWSSRRRDRSPSSPNGSRRIPSNSATTASRAACPASDS